MFEIQIKRSKRKTVSFEISGPDRLLIRAPLWMPTFAIKALVDKNEAALQKKSERYFASKPIYKYSADMVEALRNRAKAVIPPRVELWSRATGLIYSSIRITSAQKRFGSCNSKKNLCFSLFLADYPTELIDYVILHELCHTKEMNHSKRFYDLVSSFMPDWKERKSQLLSHHIIDII